MSRNNPLKTDRLGCDTEVEKNRFNQRAQGALLKGGKVIHVIDNIHPLLRPPYIEYENACRTYINQHCVALELASGTGQHSIFLLTTGAKIIFTDIASKALEVLKVRAEKAGYAVETSVCRMEETGFTDSTFDVIVIAGSLSYADPDQIEKEIIRLLKPGGTLVCVDSLNHNIIYRLNRWVHYRIRKDRSLSTIKRIPTIESLVKLGKNFSDYEIKTFGVFLWLCYPLAYVIGINNAARLSGFLDKIKFARRLGFKCLFVGKKLNKYNPD